jgi:hypothetical protein
LSKCLWQNWLQKQDFKMTSMMFVTSWYSTGFNRMIVISRLDAHATAILDMNALRKCDQPCGGNTKWNRTKSIGEEKEKVLVLLCVKRMEELKAVHNWRAKDEKLRLCIEETKPECFKRFWRSDDVARLAYARLLLGQAHVSSEARKEFADPNYPNVFGDVHLIQNALFFNAGLASNDRAVKRMARFCGLPVLLPPTNDGRCRRQAAEIN